MSADVPATVPAAVRVAVVAGMPPRFTNTSVSRPRIVRSVPPESRTTSKRP